MRVKTFRATNAKMVLAMVKSELGPDAVILSTQTVTERGKSFCEVTAAVEAEEPRSETNDRETGAPPSWRDWNRELNILKQDIYSVLRPQVDMSCLSPRHRLALEHLEKEGVCVEVIMSLWRTAQKQPDNHIFSILADVCKTRAWGAESWTEKLHLLAGPNGVGKTTALLRMALQIKKNNPKAKILAANADQRHGKGRSYLKRVAELSNLEFVDLAGPEEWLAMRNRSQKYDKIFIDLPGMAGKEILMDWLDARGLGRAKSLAVHLVLCPHYSRGQLRTFAAQYACRQIKSLVWTKLDEACNFGALINEGFRTGLPASALSFGPNLNRNLSPAQPGLIWKLIFKHQLPGENKQDVQAA